MKEITNYAIQANIDDRIQHLPDVCIKNNKYFKKNKSFYKPNL